MSTGIYPIINGTTRKQTKAYAVVDNLTRKIIKMYAVVDGKTREIFGNGIFSPLFNGVLFSYRYGTELNDGSGEYTSGRATKYGVSDGETITIKNFSAGARSNLISTSVDGKYICNLTYVASSSSGWRLYIGKYDEDSSAYIDYQNINNVENILLTNIDDIDGNQISSASCIPVITRITDDGNYIGVVFYGNYIEETYGHTRKRVWLVIFKNNGTSFEYYKTINLYKGEDDSATNLGINIDADRNLEYICLFTSVNCGGTTVADIRKMRVLHKISSQFEYEEILNIEGHTYEDDSDSDYLFASTCLITKDGKYAVLPSKTVYSSSESIEYNLYYINGSSMTIIGDGINIGSHIYTSYDGNYLYIANGNTLYGYSVTSNSCTYIGEYSQSASSMDGSSMSGGTGTVVTTHHNYEYFDETDGNYGLMGYETYKYNVGYSQGTPVRGLTQPLSMYLYLTLLSKNSSGMVTGYSKEQTLYSGTSPDAVANDYYNITTAYFIGGNLFGGGG